MSKFEWQDFSKLQTYEDLTGYLIDKNFSHGDYCHYTSLCSIDNILNSNSFWISCSTGFNDEQDKKQFEEPKCNYSLCFSTGVNENLALWYLYSGMNGKGGRIRFTSNKVKALIESGSYYLYKKRKDGTLANPVMKLIDGETMNKKFADVVYYGNKKRGENIDLKYNTMTNHQFLYDDFMKFKDSEIGFCKGLIWYHEKETRLLITLIGKAREFVLNSKSDFVVVLEFDDKIIKTIKIDLAPEIVDVKQGIAPYLSIKGFYNNFQERIKLSEYYGQVTMNLCSRCKNNKLKGEN